MNVSTDTNGNLAVALELFAMGYTPVAMRYASKTPAEKWRHWLTESRSRESIVARWRNTRHGVALLCKEIVVIDVDDENKLDLALVRCGLTTAPICRTPSGGYHVHGRMRAGVERSRQIRIHGEPFDLLTGASLSILPPSTGENGKAYEWLTSGLPAIDELPLATVAWTRKRTRKQSKETLTGGGVFREAQGSIKFPEQYCLKIQSIQGQNGSRALVRVVCVMRDAGRSAEETFAFIHGPWNAVCAEPHWSDEEILHAIRRHYRIATS